ncbi:putative HVA22-like protein g [Zea mays]|uniref:HVA22-like protein n=1 Tax=Zea mays TaxID=4577 RepID=A0A3L6DAS2_MAIZE|nr:putative HVA22-like protein g [Zea mays]
MSKADTVTMRMVSRRGVVQLVLVSAIAWVMLGLVALAFHLRPCISPVAFLSESFFYLPTYRRLAFGYAYPAYECYKTVELNKPEIVQLTFWCQYWKGVSISYAVAILTSVNNLPNLGLFPVSRILVALLTVLERFGDFIISWLPFYSKAKSVFFVYLWYPKTKESQQPSQQQQPQVQVQQAQPQKQAAPVMRRASSIAARQAAMAQQS